MRARFCGREKMLGSQMCLLSYHAEISLTFYLTQKKRRARAGTESGERWRVREQEECTRGRPSKCFMIIMSKSVWVCLRYGKSNMWTWGASVLWLLNLNKHDLIPFTKPFVSRRKPNLNCISFHHFNMKWSIWILSDVIRPLFKYFPDYLFTPYNTNLAAEVFQPRTAIHDPPLRHHSRFKRISLLY